MGPRRVVVFIGNSIFGDDRIGLVVGDILEKRLEGLGFDVHIIEGTGFALLDCLDGCDSAVVVDSVCTGRNKVGEVLTLSVGDYGTMKPAAPHFSGVPEAVQLMRELKIGVPSVSMVGINVRDPYNLSDDISSDLKRMTDAIAAEVYSRILAESGGRAVF